MYKDVDWTIVSISADLLIKCSSKKWIGKEYSMSKKIRHLVAEEPFVAAGPEGMSILNTA
jgi:hypothetical protein